MKLFSEKKMAWSGFLLGILVLGGLLLSPLPGFA
jgi:hypothetical protein